MVIKVISKIVANRLKPLMSKLTAHNQTSSVPGRQATNNIVVLQKLIHSLWKKKGKMGGMIAKIDLEKAYDRINCGGSFGK